MIRRRVRQRSTPGTNGTRRNGTLVPDVRNDSVRVPCCKRLPEHVLALTLARKRRFATFAHAGGGGERGEDR